MFRDLVDLGIGHRRQLLLTYQAWTRRDQKERYYPQMPEFLAQKRKHDPSDRFQGTWYRHYRDMFA